MIRGMIFGKSLTLYFEKPTEPERFVKWAEKFGGHEFEMMEPQVVDLTGGGEVPAPEEMEPPTPPEKWEGEVAGEGMLQDTGYLPTPPEAEKEMSEFRDEMSSNLINPLTEKLQDELDSSGEKEWNR